MAPNLGKFKKSSRALSSKSFYHSIRKKMSITFLLMLVKKMKVELKLPTKEEDLDIKAIRDDLGDAFHNGYTLVVIPRKTALCRIASLKKTPEVEMIKFNNSRYRTTLLRIEKSLKPGTKWFKHWLVNHAELLGFKFAEIAEGSYRRISPNTSVQAITQFSNGLRHQTKNRERKRSGYRQKQKLKGQTVTREFCHYKYLYFQIYMNFRNSRAVMAHKNGCSFGGPKARRGWPSMLRTARRSLHRSLRPTHVLQTLCVLVLGSAAPWTTKLC